MYDNHLTILKAVAHIYASGIMVDFVSNFTHTFLQQMGWASGLQTWFNQQLTCPSCRQTCQPELPEIDSELLKNLESEHQVAFEIRMQEMTALAQKQWEVGGANLRMPDPVRILQTCWNLSARNINYQPFTATLTMEVYVNPLNEHAILLEILWLLTDVWTPLNM